MIFLFPIIIIQIFLSVTLSALSVLVPFYQIISIEWMPIYAMSFSFVICWWTISSHNIFNHTNSFKMGRIYTTSDSTQVINDKICWYFSIKKFIRKSMYAFPFFRFNFNMPITVIKRTLPQPTSFRFFNSSPKSFFRCAMFCAHARSDNMAILEVQG